MLVAIAPTATIASIAGCYECIEPQVSNLFKRETLSGDFLQVNRYLVTELKALGLWSESMRARLKMSEGSVQDITDLPADLRAIYRSAWEIPMRALIDMAADRGAFIDQSQSLNLFVENPNIGALSSMYFHAWKKGLKTTYYLRSRPATKIAKATVLAGEAGAGVTAAARKNAGAPAGNDAFETIDVASMIAVRAADVSSMTAAGPAVAAADADAASSTTAEAVTREAAAIACSLENPEHCEACQ